MQIFRKIFNTNLKRRLLDSLTPHELQNAIIEGIKAILTKPTDEEVLLTQKEVAAFYKVTTATVIKWQKAGKIKSYGIGSDIRYKKSELLECLILMK